MKTLISFLLVAAGLAVGICGTLLLRPVSVSAADAVSHECMSTRAPFRAKKSTDAGRETVKLPPGFVPVGGGASDAGVYVVACAVVP